MNDISKYPKRWIRIETKGNVTFCRITQHLIHPKINFFKK